MLRRVRNNPFLRNVGILVSGTIISQAIVVLSSPVLSRQYPVQAFGALALFTGLMVISAVISTGRYELAIGLPQSDRRAKSIFRLIVLIGATVSVFYLFVIVIVRELLRLQILDGLFNHWWIYLAPLYIFCVAVYSGAVYWYQRFKRYKQITFVNAVQVIATTVLSLLFGFWGRVDGMIISLVAAIVIVNIYMLVSEKKLLQGKWSWAEIKSVAREYINFPRYSTFADLSVATTQQYIPIIFAFLYSSTVIGLYAMANRILRLPNIVITTAIANIFRNDAIDQIRLHGDCEQLYRSTFKKLLFLALPIYALIFAVSPYAFAFFFGEQWYEAGIYARIIAVFLLVEFVATPLNTLYHVRNKQKKLMRLQLLSAVSGAVAIFAGARWGGAQESLMLYCASALIFNVVFIYGSYTISKPVH